MSKKERCIQKARELGAWYEAELAGCGHSTFAATIDALRSEGIEIISEEVEDEFLKGLVGLTGGVGNMGLGSCGAVTGACAAVSLVSGIGRLENQIKEKRWISYWNVKTGIIDKFMEKYGAITCRPIQIRHVGRAFNSRIPEMNKALFRAAQEKVCRTPAKCTIAEGAAWAVEAIFRIMENPLDARAAKALIEKYEK